MTKEQIEKIFKALAEDRYDYEKEIEIRIASEQGKIIGADYMRQKILDIINSEREE